MYQSKLTTLQKLMLLNAHPLKQILNYIGGIIGLYFLWIHNLLFAAIFGLGFIFLGSISSVAIVKYNPYQTAKTVWGKIFLRYTSIVGFTLYVLSHILIPIAFWLHNIPLALIGLGLLIVGYFFPPKHE